MYISREEVEADMYDKFDELSQIEHSNPLTEEDIKSALETYDRQYYNFTIHDIEKLTDIRIDRNKRNYRKQKQHILVMNAIRDVIYPEGEWRNKEGRPKGSGTKEDLVREYVKNNPNDNPTEIARNLGISRPTVYKYL